MPAEVRVGVGPEVEHDVEDRAANAPNELGLLVRAPLEVHAPERPDVRGPRDAHLCELRREPRSAQLVRIPGPREETPCVRVLIELHDDGARNRSLAEPHDSGDTSGTSPYRDAAFHCEL